MDIVATSLEALIQRATSPTNPGTDNAAIDAFCGMVNKEANSAHIAAKLITTRIQSPQEWEALQSLNVLEACMKRCGSSFHTEIGKFRFLNEMIKLVSPKYLGSQTPKPVRERVLQLMYSWTVEHPKETKIKEAYQMLRKQGVVTEDPVTDVLTSGSINSRQGSSRTCVFEDEKKQRLLQKLLQSKNPEDLQAANRLIKTMVKEDERRTELMCRRATELEAARNNARLLSEMLDCYRPSVSSKEDLDLIKELHQSCERFNVQINRDFKPEETLFGDVMETTDELKQVFAKYKHSIVESVPLQRSQTTAAGTTKAASAGGATSLLDLSAPSEDSPPVLVTSVTEQLADLGLATVSASNSQSELGSLGDIFSFPAKDPVSMPVTPFNSTVLQPLSLNSGSALAPAAISSGTVKMSDEKPGALKALEDLDALGESLLKQSLPSTARAGSQFNKVPAKVPMNLLGRSLSGTSDNGMTGVETNSPTVGSVGNQASSSAALDLDFLVGNPVQSSSTIAPIDKISATLSADELLNGDDAMVDLSDDNISIVAATISPQNKLPQEAEMANSASEKSPNTNGAHRVDSDSLSNVQSKSKSDDSSKTIDVRPLNDISVSLDSIKPSPVPPLTALDERNGITVVLHLAKDSPRPDVSVYVVSTISKNTSPLSNYVFQAVVPKTCKLRLLPASSSELPALNPFFPPPAITQVLLLANPSKVSVNLKFMISYTMDDDTITEMGEVECLPMLS